MSSALVRKSLAFVDTQYRQKGPKVNLLQTSKKLTVAEAKKTQKLKEAILKADIQRLKLIKETCKIDLEEDITQKIIERAVSRKPIKKKPKPKSEQKTVFTEEDFKKFEEEYFNEG